MDPICPALLPSPSQSARARLHLIPNEKFRTSGGERNREESEMIKVKEKLSDDPFTAFQRRTATAQSGITPTLEPTTPLALWEEEFANGLEMQQLV